MSPHISKLLDQLGGGILLISRPSWRVALVVLLPLLLPPPSYSSSSSSMYTLKWIGLRQCNPQDMEVCYIVLFSIGLCLTQNKIQKKKKWKKKKQQPISQFLQVSTTTPSENVGGGSRLLSQPTAAALGNIGFQERGQTDRGQADRIFFRNWGSSLWHFRQWVLFLLSVCSIHLLVANTTTLATKFV